MALDDVYQVTATTTLAGRELSNTFYYLETTGGGSPPDVVSGALGLEFWSAIWRPWWRHVMASNVELTSTFTARMWPSVLPSVSSQFESDFGQRGGVAVPNGAAVLISARDVTNSPNYRRRFYFSGLPELDQTGSAIEAAQRGAWDSLAFNLETLTLSPPSLFPAVYTPCAFSKKLAAIPVVPPIFPFALFSLSFVTYALRSQRQRNPREIVA